MSSIWSHTNKYLMWLPYQVCPYLCIYQVPMEMLGLAQQLYNKANYSYGDDAPCYSPVKMLEESLGEDLR